MRSDESDTTESQQQQLTLTETRQILAAVDLQLEKELTLNEALKILEVLREQEKVVRSNRTEVKTGSKSKREFNPIALENLLSKIKKQKQVVKLRIINLLKQQEQQPVEQCPTTEISSANPSNNSVSREKNANKKNDNTENKNESILSQSQQQPSSQPTSESTSGGATSNVKITQPGAQNTSNNSPIIQRDQKQNYQPLPYKEREIEQKV
jgi:hypothetical protein